MASQSERFYYEENPFGGFDVIDNRNPHRSVTSVSFERDAYKATARLNGYCGQQDEWLAYYRVVDREAVKC